MKGRGGGCEERMGVGGILELKPDVISAAAKSSNDKGSFWLFVTRKGSLFRSEVVAV